MNDRDREDFTVRMDSEWGAIRTRSFHPLRPSRAQMTAFVRFFQPPTAELQALDEPQGFDILGGVNLDALPPRPSPTLLHLVDDQEWLSDEWLDDDYWEAA